MISSRIGASRIGFHTAALLLGLGAIAGCGSGSEDMSDSALPVVDLVDSSGQTVSTTSLTGAPTVINFWYSSCAPCATELRDFADVHSDFGDEVRFVGVNPLDSIDDMIAFAGERGVTYELFRDELAEFQDALGLSAFPVTLFVDSGGTILEQTGVLDESQLTTRVERLLAAETGGESGAG